MIKKIYLKMQFLKHINLRKYIILNYFCKSIIRNGCGKIIPYKGAVIDLEKYSKIYIHNSDLRIGTNRLRGSNVETYIRLRSGAVWNAKGGCEISYGSTIEVLADAEFDTEYFTMNSSSTVVAKKRIVFGSDVMIARNVVIYDSDFHAMECGGIETLMSKEVHIGNHVWIGANSTVLKGVTIQDGSVISANTLVTKDVEEKVLVGNEQKLITLRNSVEWKR